MGIGEKCSKWKVTKGLVCSFCHDVTKSVSHLFQNQPVVAGPAASKPAAAMAEPRKVRKPSLYETVSMVSLDTWPIGMPSGS